MRFFREASILPAFILLLFGLNAVAQSASYYQQAAALYDQAAAKCSEPGASCMRKYAAYNRCLAAQYGGGGSCGTSPTCSTACSNSASSGGSGSSGGGTNNTNAQINQLAQSIGDLLGQWAAAREAKHEREAQELQRRAEQDAAQMEAESKAEDQRARERAAFFADPSSVNSVADQTPSDPGVTLRNQLSAGGDTGAAQSQQTASVDPSDQLAQLRAQLTAQAVQEDQSAAGLPTIPSIQAIDDQEAEEANFLGADWDSAMAQAKDTALSQLKSQFDPLDPPLPNDDYLKSGAQATMQSLLPSTDESDVTLGSMVQDKAVDMASDKVADTLTESKDQLACSGQETQVDQNGCMVLMAPTNLGRGLYNYGKLLVNRFGTFMDSVNQAMELPATP